MYDGYTVNSKVQPESIAKLTVSFVAEGKNLREVRSSFRQDSQIITHSTQIASISVRGVPLNYRDVEATHTRYTFTPDGRLFQVTMQTYDALNGKLVQEVVESSEGYRLVKNYTYANNSWVYYDDAGQPFFVPTAVETFVEVGGVRVLVSRAVNTGIDFASETVTQRITYYNPIGAVSNEVTRIVNVAAGNTLEEKDEDGYTRYEYQSAFLELLGIAAKVTKYAYDGQALSVTTFDQKTGIKLTYNGVRIETHTNDIVNGIMILQEKDNIGNIFREVRSNNYTRREFIRHYSNPLWAG